VDYGLKLVSKQKEIAISPHQGERLTGVNITHKRCQPKVRLTLKVGELINKGKNFTPKKLGLSTQ